MLEKQTLVAFVGWPASGKSELARRIATILNERHIDIDDDARVPYFGKPVPNDGTDPAIKARDDAEMAGSYNILFGLVSGYMRAGRSLIVTATLSSKKWGQDRLKSVYEQYPNAKVRVIWCKPNLTDTELEERLSARSANYTGATSSVSRLRELEKRYEEIELPHLELDTSMPENIGGCVDEAIAYILS